MTRARTLRRTLRLAAGAALAVSATFAAACGEAGDPLTPSTMSAPQFTKKATSPTKFTFSDVTLTDQDGTTFTGATIRATTKKVDDSSGVTVCEYATADEAYLGQFQAAEFVAADQVLAYCTLHFADRQVR